MTTKEEEYIHIKYSIINITQSWMILNEITQGSTSPILLHAAFRYALIEYSKPFKNSRGEKKVGTEKVNFHKLNHDVVPEEHSDLHNRIVNARDQLHAHSDLALWEARVFIDDDKDVFLSRNTIHGMEEFHNIDSILELAEKTLVALYERKKSLEDELVANSVDAPKARD